MAKKIIAVVPLWDDEKESIWMLPGYMNGIKEAGAIPVILPLVSEQQDALEVFEKCDGLLMTGGHDVSPSLFRNLPWYPADQCFTRRYALSGFADGICKWH